MSVFECVSDSSSEKNIECDKINLKQFKHQLFRKVNNVLKTQEVHKTLKLKFLCENPTLGSIYDKPSSILIRLLC